MRSPTMSIAIPDSWDAPALATNEPLTSFAYFSQLPYEVRILIWRLSLPHRVVELDYGQPGIERFDPSKGHEVNCPRSRAITTYNIGLPVLARVNHEARDFVLQEWTQLSKLEATKGGKKKKKGPKRTTEEVQMDAEHPSARAVA
jgi:hypothetical protein